MFWCCCQSTTGVPCDSYQTGYVDGFGTLQVATDKGGWGWQVPAGVTPAIAPPSSLVINYDVTQVGIPSTFFRCAQYSAQQAYYGYRAIGGWFASGSQQLFGALSGVTLNASFYSALNGNQVYAAYHWVEFEENVGWRHVLRTDVNGVNLLAWRGDVLQANAEPVPQGPFLFDFGFRMLRNTAGAWEMKTQWQGVDVGNVRNIAAPQNANLEFSHGFSLQFDLISAVLDEWRYETVQP